MRHMISRINEISKNKNSALTNIGVGKDNIRKKIIDYFDSILYGRDAYSIDDDLNVTLKNQTNYKNLYYHKPSYINIRLKLNATSFIMACVVKNVIELNNLLKDYDQLEINVQDKYKDLVNKMEAAGFRHISMRNQLHNETIVFLDMKNFRVYACYFRKGDCIIRSYSSGMFYDYKPFIVKIIQGGNFDDIVSSIINRKFRKSRNTDNTRNFFI